jgi:uncharacterized protein YndB with AHSA1/START domain
MKPLIITKEKVVKTKPHALWRIITTPSYFERWMYVPGQAVDDRPLKLGSEIHWINEAGIVYLKGTVIEQIPERKLVISLQDISWKRPVAEGKVIYSYELQPVTQGTLVKFYLGDLSVDPEAELWYDSYSASDEIGAIEKLIEPT